MTARRFDVSLDGRKVAIWVDDVDGYKVGANFEDVGYMTPEQARAAAQRLVEAADEADGLNSLRCVLGRPSRWELE